MTTVTIPTLETERLILRPPRMEDTGPIFDVYSSERAKFVGGPIDNIRTVARAMGEIAGQWLLRGVSSFIAEEKATPGVPVGSFGAWEPYTWPEMEYGWTLWTSDDEGKGYVTEAMRKIIPWTWEWTGKDTAISVIDEGNDGSVRVAEALGAVFDPETTERETSDGGAFAGHTPKVNIYRHRKGALG